MCVAVVVGFLAWSIVSSSPLRESIAADSENCVTTNTTNSLCGKNLPCFHYVKVSIVSEVVPSMVGLHTQLHCSLVCPYNCTHEFALAGFSIS